MNKLSGVTLIDEEEYDLQKSLVDLDVKVFSKPTMQQQKKFLEAAKKYNKFAKENFGEFAYLNKF